MSCKCCFISWFYIKPQHCYPSPANGQCCFISWFYIKPQQIVHEFSVLVVALYLDSTSNHNWRRWPTVYRCVALYLDSTSNHNSARKVNKKYLLLYILILHQTTTITSLTLLFLGCFISWFYIKPQHISLPNTKHHVALYLDSTSNHNILPANSFKYLLLYILILHQTTTKDGKPGKDAVLLYILILHQTTTTDGEIKSGPALLYILILHQTTTSRCHA